jgi:hypothetical protein
VRRFQIVAHEAHFERESPTQRPTERIMPYRFFAGGEDSHPRLAPDLRDHAQASRGKWLPLLNQDRNIAKSARSVVES